ncbi:MAG: glutamate racemase [Micavibrio aeruginosavorus]|nr:glutamate racemase [Micavibrio aeruginosavorus]
MTQTAFSRDPRPIGVFDSGVGGLTVLKSLMAKMPGEKFIYLGDTARVPYGTKSAETVQAYSTGLARVLLRHGVKMIVIACNTASVHGAEAVAALAAPVPVISMIPPAVRAAIKATRNKSVLLMATQSTVRSGSYHRALSAADPAVTVTSVPTQVLVALAEEGWVDGPETLAVIQRYIAPALRQEPRPDTIILGCTHFPLMREAIAKVAGPGVTLIDSGQAAADSITAQFTPGAATGGTPDIRFLVTDSAERFQPMAERFLGQTIDLSSITHIDLAAFDIAQAASHSVDAAE